MRRKGAADTPAPNRKANTAEQTAAELAAIGQELPEYENTQVVIPWYAIL